MPHCLRISKYTNVEIFIIRWHSAHQRHFYVQKIYYEKCECFYKIRPISGLEPFQPHPFSSYIFPTANIQVKYMIFQKIKKKIFFLDMIWNAVQALKPVKETEEIPNDYFLSSFHVFFILFLINHSIFFDKVFFFT